jgi:large subunit ribosomal protein L20
MRVKRGINKKQKHKKVLDQAKGYRMTYSKLYRRAKEALLHAGAYSHAHRRRRRSQMRGEWIQTISAKLAGTGMSYSNFMSALKTNKVDIDRKNLAHMVLSHPDHFDSLVSEISAE